MQMEKVKVFYRSKHTSFFFFVYFIDIQGVLLESDSVCKCMIRISEFIDFCD